MTRRERLIEWIVLECEELLETIHEDWDWEHKAFNNARSILAAARELKEMKDREIEA